MSADKTRRQGTLEIKTFAKGLEVKSLVECPFCDHKFDENEPRWKHHLEEHGPEIIPEPSGGDSA